MLPIIRFKTAGGADVIVVFRAAVADKSGAVEVYEHGDLDADARYVLETGVTLDDVHRAVNYSLAGPSVARVTRSDAPA